MPHWLPVPMPEDSPVTSLSVEPDGTPYQPAMGQVEFLVMGYRRPDGGVEVWATSDLFSADIEWDFDEVVDWRHSAIHQVRNGRSSFHAKCGEWVSARGRSFAEAFGVIGSNWDGRDD